MFVFIDFITIVLIDFINSFKLVRGIMSQATNAHDLSMNFTQAFAEWIEEDGEVEWEVGEIWNSPNLVGIVDELLTADPDTSTLSVLLTASSESAARGFNSFDASACFAPHLVFQLKEPI